MKATPYEELISSPTDTSGEQPISSLQNRILLLMLICYVLSFI